MKQVLKNIHRRNFFLTLILIVSANERVLIDFKKDGKNPGFIPDGMTIDTDQNLYVATWGGSKIFKIDPELVRTSNLSFFYAFLMPTIFRLQTRKSHFRNSIAG